MARRATAAFESALPPEATGSSDAGIQMSAQEKYLAKLAAFELMSTLRSIDLFTGLSDDDLSTLARRLEKSTYRWKQWVFKQGDVGDRLYIITEGEARVIRSSDGHEELLKELSVGDAFGERALLKLEPRFAGVRCTSAEMTTLSIDKASFEAALGPLEAYVKQVEYAQPTGPRPETHEIQRSHTRSRFATGIPAVRRHKVAAAQQKHKAFSLIEGGRPLANGKHATFKKIMQADVERKKLLTLAREINPIGAFCSALLRLLLLLLLHSDIHRCPHQTTPHSHSISALTTINLYSRADSIARMAALPRTVIPRIATHALTWLVFGVYAGSATTCRLGVDFGVRDLTSFDSSNTLVTFMIVFYVGYCYNRYTAQFEEVEQIMHTICETCSLARVCFRSPAEVRRLWRYLNLLQAAAYTGLSSAYDEANFFMPLCKRHNLLPTSESQRTSEVDAFNAISNGDGESACTVFQVWALEIVQHEVWATDARITPPIHAQLNDLIRKIGQGTKRLHAYTCTFAGDRRRRHLGIAAPNHILTSYLRSLVETDQVLPFIYTHLVSLMCTLYLLFNAFIKGVYFEPGASYTFGLILPLCSMLTTTLAVFGLLEVGDTILDPFGCDPEDFTVLVSLPEV